MGKEPIKSHEDLEVYRMAFDAAMTIFQLSKKFPVEERYSLTDQIRRSSRSVCANLAEAWRKRRYEAAFVAKLNECEAEAAETQTWLKFAVKCDYLEHSLLMWLEMCLTLAFMLMLLHLLRLPHFILQATGSEKRGNIFAVKTSKLFRSKNNRTK